MLLQEVYLFESLKKSATASKFFFLYLSAGEGRKYQRRGNFALFPQKNLPPTMPPVTTSNKSGLLAIKKLFFLWGGGMTLRFCTGFEVLFVAK